MNPDFYSFFSDLDTAGYVGLLAMAFISVLTSLLIALGITYTSPIFIRIGATLSSPASIIFERSEKIKIGIICYIGCLLTILGFVFINL
jgi:drug/metabolite transporter (DMT)-like permease